LHYLESSENKKLLCIKSLLNVPIFCRYKKDTTFLTILQNLKLNFKYSSNLKNYDITIYYKNILVQDVTKKLSEFNINQDSLIDSLNLGLEYDPKETKKHIAPPFTDE